MKLTSVIDKVTTFQGNIHLLYIAEFQNLLFLCMTQGLNRQTCQCRLYHRIINKTCSTFSIREDGTPYPSGAPQTAHIFSGFHPFLVVLFFFQVSGFCPLLIYRFLKQNYILQIADTPDIEVLCLFCRITISIINGLIVRSHDLQCYTVY